MNENTLVSTTQLQKRYGITKATVYRMLRALSIKPMRKGNKSYLTADQLQLADDLNAYMKSSGTMEEFVQQCQASGKIVALEKPALVEPTTETAIVHHNEVQITALQHQEAAQATTKETALNSRATRQDKIENLQVQKRKQTRLKDIQEVNERAQKRAFDKAMLEEELLLIYEATEEFGPELKEQLAQHRAACNQARVKAMAAYDVDDFLSEAIQMTGIKF